MRLQKIIARAGIASRRKAEDLIRDGRVRVNGEVTREPGARANPETDKISLDGKTLRLEKPAYILLHKPAGVISAVEDPEGRHTLMDMLPEMRARLFPVGRLDFDATGLVLLTNDGDVAQALAHPSGKSAKTYLVKVKGRPDEKDLNKLRRGIRLDDGKKTLPAKVEATEVRIKGKSVSKNSWLTFVLNEGKNRQIKRMCVATGHPALKIHRIAVGPLKLGNIQSGTWRYATSKEIKALKSLIEPAKQA